MKGRRIHVRKTASSSSLVPTTTPLCPTAVWNQTVSVVAGATSNPGSTSTLLSSPYGLDVDEFRFLYVVDYGNHRVQRFAPGSVTGVTVAGVSGSAGSSRSLLYYPTAISVMSNGTMFIMDTSNYRVIRWQVSDPLGITVAGGSNGAAFTQIGASYALYVDQQYNVYVSENSNHRVTKWSATNTTSGVLVLIAC